MKNPPPKKRLGPWPPEFLTMPHPQHEAEQTSRNVATTARFYSTLIRNEARALETAGAKREFVKHFDDTAARFEIVARTAESDARRLARKAP